jgi:hypothetical protein
MLPTVSGIECGDPPAQATRGSRWMRLNAVKAGCVIAATLGVSGAAFGALLLLLRGVMG